MRFLYSSTVFAFFLRVNNSLFATDSSSTSTTECSASSACIQAGKGLLSKNTKVAESVQTMNWIFSSFSLACTIIFLIMASKKLSEHDYVGSLGPFLGAVVAGISLFVAKSLAV